MQWRFTSLTVPAAYLTDSVSPHLAERQWVLYAQKRSKQSVDGT